MRLEGALIKLKEIAEKANVSISTVSRIINNQGNFSDDTRRKVLDIANEYLKPGITPSRMVGISYSIAVFVPDVNDFFDNDPSSSADLNDLKEEFESYGHQFHMATHTADLSPASSAYRLLNEKKIDAAVIFDPFVGDSLVEELMNRGIPYLITNGRNYEAAQNYIDYDNRKGAYDVIHYLYGLGHRQIGMIAGPSEHLVNENRLRGCRDAFLQLGMPWMESNILMGAFDPAHGHQAVKKMLAEHPDITAIFAFNDIIAFGAMKGLAELKLRVPRDVSLIGFDDLKLSEFMMPPLTTVRRFRYDISQLIVKMLTELITNKNISEVNISLKTELIERESCAKVMVREQ
ncbi:LacI family DNA-binding transcriptional regulator [Cohnella herbarum]|uniref:LacI family DNA-binding transcriptional regulator n=1 Tax=Cohnella herbarum TaxID=2728023 RepID=UPI0028734AC2|nr:LacI family DNA-binding transcriptional regulator [Cohnella herbarum]